MSKCRIALVGLAAVSLWSVPVRAQSPESVALLAMMGDGPVLVVPLLLRFGDLTAEQENRVQQIVATDHAHVQDLLQQLGTANEQLAQTLLTTQKGQARAASPHGPTAR